MAPPPRPPGRWPHRGRAAAAAVVLAGLARAAAADDGRLPRNSIQISAGPSSARLSTREQERAAFDLTYLDGKGWLGRHPVLVRGQYGRYLFDRQGLLGVYLGAGVWHQTGNARICRDSDGEIVACTPETFRDSQPGNDKAHLTVMPVGAGVLYRADQLRRASLLPLTFAAQAGVDYHLYWASIGASRSTLANGGPARGGVFGLSAALQAAYGLEGLRRGAPAYGSRFARPALYVFAEARLTYAPGLLQAGRRLDFTDLGQLALGIAVESY